MARYKANSPEETDMFLTNMLRVPNITIEEISIKREFVVFFIVYSNKTRLYVSRVVFIKVF